jgi:hypothetical protein
MAFGPTIGLLEGKLPVRKLNAPANQFLTVIFSGDQMVPVLKWFQ